MNRGRSGAKIGDVRWESAVPDRWPRERRWAALHHTSRRSPSGGAGAEAKLRRFPGVSAVFSPARCNSVVPAALMMAMKYGIQALVVAFLLCTTASPAAEQAESVPTALHAALVKNTQHAREWLDQAD